MAERLDLHVQKTWWLSAVGTSRRRQYQRNRQRFQITATRLALSSEGTLREPTGSQDLASDTKCRPFQVLL